MRWNLKEAVSKSLVRRTEITYKARLRGTSWHKATKSNNYHICSSRVTMDKITNKKLFVLVSALVIVLDCTIDILLLRAFWKKSEE